MNVVYVVLKARFVGSVKLRTGIRALRQTDRFGMSRKKFKANPIANGKKTDPGIWGEHDSLSSVESS